MPKTLGISPKLAAAIATPLTAVVTNIILTGELDRTSLAALAAIAIGAVLGYHAPPGAQKLPAVGIQPVTSTGTSNVSAGSFQASPPLDGMAGTMGPRPTLNHPHDDGDDGDDQLPADLADREPHSNPPPDEIDQPEVQS